MIDFNHDDKNATNTGQSILTIDLAAFGDPLAFRRHVDTVVREIRASERMPGVERIWTPGEQSNARRIAYARDGIPIPPQLAANLAKVAAELGIEPLA